MTNLLQEIPLYAKEEGNLLIYSIHTRAHGFKCGRWMTHITLLMVAGKPQLHVLRPEDSSGSTSSYQKDKYMRDC